MRSQTNPVNPFTVGLLFAHLEDDNQDIDEGGGPSTRTTQSRPRIPSKLGDRYKWQVRTQHEYRSPPSEELAQRMEYLNLGLDLPKEKGMVADHIKPPRVIEEANEERGRSSNRICPTPEQHEPPEGSFSDLTEAFSMGKNTYLRAVSSTDELMAPTSPLDHPLEPLPRRTKSDQHLSTIAPIAPIAPRKNWTWPTDTVWKEAYPNSTKHLSTKTIQRLIQSGLYTENEQGIRETVTGRYILLKLGHTKDQTVREDEDVVKRHARKVLNRVNSITEDDSHTEREGTPFTDEDELRNRAKARFSVPTKRVRFKAVKEMVEENGELVVEAVVDNEGKSGQGQTAPRSKQQAKRGKSFLLGWMEG